METPPLSVPALVPCLVSGIAPIVASLLLAAAVGAAAPPAQAQDKPPVRLQLHADGSAFVQGRVAANRRDCERDLPCYLVMDGAARPLHLLYHHGEGDTPCASADITRTGLALAAGAAVEARGRYRKTGGADIVDLCAPGAYLRAPVRDRREDGRR